MLFVWARMDPKAQTVCERGKMILLVPIGEVEEATLETLGQSLAQVFGSRIEIGDRVLLAQSGDPRRGQYRASTLLALVPSSASGNRALGVVDVDIFAPGLNFAFGQDT